MQSSTEPFALSFVEELRESFHTVWLSEASRIFRPLQSRDSSAESILGVAEGHQENNEFGPMISCKRAFKFVPTGL